MKFNFVTLAGIAVTPNVPSAHLLKLLLCRLGYAVHGTWTTSKSCGWARRICAWVWVVKVKDCGYAGAASVTAWLSVLAFLCSLLHLRNPLQPRCTYHDELGRKHGKSSFQGFLNSQAAVWETACFCDMKRIRIPEHERDDAVLTGFRSGPMFVGSIRTMVGFIQKIGASSVGPNCGR